MSWVGTSIWHIIRIRLFQNNPSAVENGYRCWCIISCVCLRRLSIYPSQKICVSITETPHKYHSGPCPVHFASWPHYNDVILRAMAHQITSLTIVYSTVYSGTDRRKHQSSASLAFVRGSHRWPVNSPHKGPVTRKMFPFDDVIIFKAQSLAKYFGDFIYALLPLHSYVQCLCSNYKHHKNI